MMQAEYKCVNRRCRFYARSWFGMLPAAVRAATGRSAMCSCGEALTLAREFEATGELAKALDAAGVKA